MYLSLGTSSQVVAIDDQDYSIVKDYKWYKHSSGYAVSSGGKFLMHRVLLNPPKGICIDHIDGDKLNNRRSNLRLASYSLNAHNRYAAPKSSKTGITGVRRITDNCFHVYIWFQYKYTYIGSVHSLVEAAKMRAEAELKYFYEISPRTNAWLQAHQGE